MKPKKKSYRSGGFFFFAFITGRSPHYSQDAYRAAQPNVPFGCMNGGAVYDGERHAYIWMREMPADVMEIVADMERQLPTVGIQIAGFGNVKADETVSLTRFCCDLRQVVIFSCNLKKKNPPVWRVLLFAFLAWFKFGGIEENG